MLSSQPVEAEEASEIARVYCFGRDSAFFDSAPRPCGFRNHRAMSDDRAASAERSEEDSADESGEEEGESAGRSADERFKLRLIKEVEKRPPLWNNESKNYSNKSVKQVWRDLTKKLHAKDWNKMDDDDREQEVKMSQKTWKNMKDSFIRNVNRRKRGEDVKRYCYYQQMRFLLPVKRERWADNAEEPTPGTSDGWRGKGLYKCFRKELASNQESPGTRTRDEAPSRPPSNDLAPCQKSVGKSTLDDASSSHSGKDPAIHLTKTPGTSVVRYDEPSGPSSEFATNVLPAQSGQQTMTPFEYFLLEIMRAKRAEEPDEDKDFAFSLVPMLKKLDDDQKFIAKTEILKVMKSARVPDESADSAVPDEPEPVPSHTDETQSIKSQNQSDESDCDESGPRK